MKREQTMRCRHDGHTVTGTRAVIEQVMGAHLMTVHKITDSLRMGLSIERVQ